MSTTQPVDLVDLCALAGMPYVPDPRGRIFIGAPEAGEIAITPSGDGYDAAVSLTEAGRFVRANHDDIPPGAAAERVLLFCALADRRRREGTAADEIDRRLQAAIMASPTLGGTTGQQAAAIAKAQILGPGRSASRNALTDPFERHWLRRAFSIGQALDDAEPRPNAHDPWGYGDGLVMEFGMPECSAAAPDDDGKSVVSLIRTAGEPWVRGAVHAGEGEAAGRVGFCLCAESALLLLAVEEGLRYAMSPDIRLDLARLRGDVIAADVGWRAGFRRLTELFAPWPWPTDTETLPVRQLTAIATTAMRVAAVRARSSAGGAIDLKQIEELSGCKPARRGDEYVLAADRHELVFGVVEDVVVGRVQMLGLSGRSWAVSTVLDAETLAWVVWALATRNVVKADELDAAIRRSIVEPWFDYESDRRRTIDGLGRIARGKNRSRRRAAAELLGRLNSPSR